MRRVHAHIDRRLGRAIEPREHTDHDQECASSSGHAAAQPLEEAYFHLIVATFHFQAVSLVARRAALKTWGEINQYFFLRLRRRGNHVECPPISRADPSYLRGPNFPTASYAGGEGSGTRALL